MPLHTLSTRHASAKTFNEMGLSLSPASALPMRDNHCTTYVARISIARRDYPCPSWWVAL